MKREQIRTIKTRVDLDPSSADDNVHFSVTEGVVLSDATEIQSPIKRGWTVFTGTTSSDEFLQSQRPGDILREAQNCMLPDDAELTGKRRDWSQLADTLARSGLEVSVNQLQATPHITVLSERLRAALQ